MKILVLGGSGFFGQSILDYFQRYIVRKNKNSILILASRNISNIKNYIHVDYIDKNVQLVSLDVLSCNKIPDADIIIHAANITDEREYSENPQEQIKLIVSGTENIIKLVKKTSSFIYISSGAVYGIQDKISDAFSEECKSNTTMYDGTKKIYAEAKIIAENIIKEYSQSDKLSSCIARCFSFIGKFTPRNQHFIIGNILNSIEKKTSLKINSNKLVYRSFMYSDDLVRALLFINRYSNINTEVFNIGSDEYFETHQLIKSLSSVYNFKYHGNTEVSSKSSDIYVPNIEKLLSYGFKSNYTLHTSIKNIIN